MDSVRFYCGTKEEKQQLCIRGPVAGFPPRSSWFRFDRKREREPHTKQPTVNGRAAAKLRGRICTVISSVHASVELPGAERTAFENVSSSFYIYPPPTPPSLTSLSPAPLSTTCFVTLLFHLARRSRCDAAASGCPQAAAAPLTGARRLFHFCSSDSPTLCSLATAVPDVLVSCHQQLRYKTNLLILYDFNNWVYSALANC